MNTILSRLTFGDPKRLIKPAVWLFFEDFFTFFPAVAVFIAVNEVVIVLEGGSLNYPLLLGVAGVVLAMAVVQFFIGCTALNNSMIPAARYTSQGRFEFVMKLRRLPLGFFSKKETGELINNFVGDFLQIQQSLTGYLSGLFGVVFSCILTFIVMFIYNPLLAASFYVAIPIATILLIVSLRVLDRNALRVAKARDKAATNLYEYLHGMKTLKSYNQTGEGFGKLKDAYRELMKRAVQAESGSGSFIRLCTTLVRFGIPLVCITGSYMLLGGTFTVVEFICIIIIGTRILTPVVLVVSNMMMLRNNYVSARRLAATMQEEEMAGSDTEISDNPHLVFKNVYFSYRSTVSPVQEVEKVLSDISFEIPQGKLTAIVGPSGSGKTTILRLITRFWDVDEGAILCDGKPLSSLNAEAWQKSISMVMQDVYLFNETIRENIFFGRQDATEDEMIDAAMRAGCHEFIMAMPDAYDTVIGEGGSTLSGGEKQRISLARALLKKTPILLLDEPTASLDARNEALVQHAINELVQDTTVVMIAHRLKTVQNADQILVMDKGRLCERGTHTELLEQRGVYTKLWNMQQSMLDYQLKA